jgi:hypothetical protein
VPTLGLPTASPATASAPVATVSEDESGLPWAALLGGGALLLVGAGVGGWVMRRRPSRPLRSSAPALEKPRIVPSAPPPSAPPATAAPREPLQVALEPLRLSLTLMNAALAYRLELTNNGASTLQGLHIEADMISAHASMSREQQLAGPGEGAPTVHMIEGLEPGESRIVEGEFRLPFPQIVPIRQGNAALLLPLARFRAQAQATQPVVRTFAVGQRGATGLQPFRLDQGPRVYPQLMQRAFA